MRTYDFPPILTLDQGLEIQKQQLIRWSMILLPAIQRQLEDEAVRQNQALNKHCSGYDVWRGCEMDSFVQNIAYKLCPVNS